MVRRRAIGRLVWTLGLAVALLFLPSCASLGGLRQFVQVPRFERAPDRQAEILLAGPSAGSPVGGATVRIWTTITNPNPFGFTLSTVRATLLLSGTRAATGDFPLGLPLRAGQSSTVPLELLVSFTDLPGLGQVARAALRGESVPYQLDGTVGVDAGALGQPVFGPMTLLTGQLRPR